MISKNSWTGLLKDDFVFTPKNVKPDQTIILIGITAEENTYRFSVNECILVQVAFQLRF